MLASTLNRLHNRQIMTQMFGRVVSGARYVINCEITFWTSTRLGALYRFVSAMEQIQIRYFTSCSLSVGVVHRLLSNYFLDNLRKNTLADSVKARALNYFDLRSVCGEFIADRSLTPPIVTRLQIYHLTQPPCTRPLNFFFFLCTAVLRLKVLFIKLLLYQCIQSQSLLSEFYRSE